MRIKKDNWIYGKVATISSKYGGRCFEIIHEEYAPEHFPDKLSISILRDKDQRMSIELEGKLEDCRNWERRE